MYSSFPKKKVKDPASQEHAHQYALFLLNLRLRTEGEMREKMKQRGYELSVIEAEVASLAENKYIDDERFAEILTDNLKKYKHFGYYMIMKKMMVKRLPQNLIQKTLNLYFSPEDELKVAKTFLARQSLKAAENYKDKQKLRAKLKSRGFRNEVISKIIV